MTGFRDISSISTEHFIICEPNTTNSYLPSFEERCKPAFNYEKKKSPLPLSPILLRSSVGMQTIAETMLNICLINLWPTRCRRKPKLSHFLVRCKCHKIKLIRLIAQLMLQNTATYKMQGQLKTNIVVALQSTRCA